MGRAPCCEKIGLKRGRWTEEEDKILLNYIKTNGEGSWRSLPKKAGISRCGKSCRLRWINYLRADLKRGNFTAQEEETIINFRNSIGNRWSLIASQLPGRTDNEIKNYWNSHLSRKLYSFGSLNQSTLTSMDHVTEMVMKSRKRFGRVSRSVAKKYNKNIFSLSKSPALVEKPLIHDHDDDIIKITEKQVENDISDPLDVSYTGLMPLCYGDEKCHLLDAFMSEEDLIIESEVQGPYNKDLNDKIMNLRQILENGVSDSEDSHPISNPNQEIYDENCLLVDEEEKEKLERSSLYGCIDDSVEPAAPDVDGVEIWCEEDIDIFFAQWDNQNFRPDVL